MVDSVLASWAQQLSRLAQQALRGLLDQALVAGVVQLDEMGRLHASSNLEWAPELARPGQLAAPLGCACYWPNSLLAVSAISRPW